MMDNDVVWSISRGVNRLCAREVKYGFKDRWIVITMNRPGNGDAPWPDNGERRYVVTSYEPSEGFGV